MALATFKCSAVTTWIGPAVFLSFRSMTAVITSAVVNGSSSSLFSIYVKTNSGSTSLFDLANLLKWCSYLFFQEGLRVIGDLASDGFPQVFLLCTWSLNLELHLSFEDGRHANIVVTNFTVVVHIMSCRQIHLFAYHH